MIDEPSDRATLKNHIHKMGRIDIESLVALYDDPQIKRRLRGSFVDFCKDHPDWEEQRLFLLGSFLKRLMFDTTGRWPTKVYQSRISDRKILRNHIRRMGGFDIESLVALYDPPEIKKRLRSAWKNFNDAHPDWEEQRLNLMDSFLKKVGFGRNGGWSIKSKGNNS